MQTALFIGCNFEKKDESQILGMSLEPTSSTSPEEEEDQEDELFGCHCRCHQHSSFLDLREQEEE